jgi:phosphoglycerol transferase MdoB-like AlkP superfamily enzyme
MCEERMIELRLNTIAIIAIIFILTGFGLFLTSLFMQNSNWLPSVFAFGIGFILYIVAKTIRAYQEKVRGDR